MRAVKAKALRELVSDFPQSTATMEYGRSSRLVPDGLNQDGSDKFTEKAVDFPLTFRHNGRRSRYQRLKKLYKHDKFLLYR